MKDLVSIVMPLYNAEKFLKKTVQSVINQTYKNWELIIVNDCSPDNSLNIAQGIDDDRVKVYSLEENSGSGIARNLGIFKAEGDYITFLDADDIWDDKKLELHIAFMKEKNADFSHCNYGYIDENDKPIKEEFHVSEEVTYKQLLKRTEISCLTGMYYAKRIGKFYMSEHRRKQDYALWLSILKSGYKSYGLNECLAYYRQHSGSATTKKYKLILRHITFLRDTQGMNLFQSLYYTFWYVYNGVIKYYL
ncbi:glycosyltransferase [Cyclobacteriaceae bacterium]|nr:glycosyltransferase [Cyclobacteriaceae bacterium]